PITTYGKLGYKDYYIPFSYNYPKILSSGGYVSKGYDKPYKIGIIPSFKPVTIGPQDYKTTTPFKPSYKTQVDKKKPVYPQTVMTTPKLPPISRYDTKKSRFKPIPPRHRLKIPIIEERPKPKRKTDPLSLGYKFRLFEPTKFKYKSPIKI
ncbi:MAG: hypothetical protein GWN93_15280, partial [Deltaproteobacteria bacterium]|nr:hypothetical protein [Deltaproteobacteria bacterium]